MRDTGAIVEQVQAAGVEPGPAAAYTVVNLDTPQLELIGQGRKMHIASAPCIAAPTTAGTGSEVTRNAVLASHEHRVKASLRSPLMAPPLVGGRSRTDPLACLRRSRPAPASTR